MKKTTLLIGMLLLLFLPGFSQRRETNILKNVQDKLNWQTPKDTLIDYIKAMEQLQSGTTNPYLNYWEAYAQYRLYFEFNQENSGEKQQAEKAVAAGLKLIDEVKNKTADHYALLSLLGGLELNFTNVLMLPFRAAKVGKNAETAIEKDPTNPRGYVALGIYDYYTPKMYGGMKVVETNLKKALTLKEKNDPNPYSPTWGKPEAYLYLVKFYRHAKQMDSARKYLNEGLAHYPDFDLLRSMRKKLETPQ